MAEGDTPADLAYYAALGHVVESSGTLEHLIYMVGEFVFDMPESERQSNRPATTILKEIRRKAAGLGLLDDPKDMSLTDQWIGSCTSALRQRGDVVHVVGVISGPNQVHGVQRTNQLAAPLRVRDAHQMELLHKSLVLHCTSTAKMFSYLWYLRRAHEPGWEMPS